MALDPSFIPVSKPGFPRVWQAYEEATARGRSGSVADRVRADLLLNALRFAHQCDTTIEAGLAHNGIDPDTLERI